MGNLLLKRKVQRKLVRASTVNENIVYDVAEKLMNGLIQKGLLTR